MKQRYILTGNEAGWRLNIARLYIYVENISKSDMEDYIKKEDMYPGDFIVTVCFE